MFTLKLVFIVDEELFFIFTTKLKPLPPFTYVSLESKICILLSLGPNNEQAVIVKGVKAIINIIISATILKCFFLIFISYNIYFYIVYHNIIRQNKPSRLSKRGRCSYISVSAVPPDSV